MVFGSAYKWEGKRGGDVLRVDENAPQAVIADATALKEVEGGLLLLSSACKAASVPLFVINDPRVVWGSGDKVGGSEEELFTASKALREKVKGTVVQKALKIKEGEAYIRGKEHGKKQAEDLGQMKRRRDEGRWRGKVERLERRLREGLTGATVAELHAELERRRASAERGQRNAGGNPQGS